MVYLCKPVQEFLNMYPQLKRTVFINCTVDDLAEARPFMARDKIGVELANGTKYFEYDTATTWKAV